MSVKNVGRSGIGQAMKLIKPLEGAYKGGKDDRRHQKSPQQMMLERLYSDGFDGAKKAPASAASHLKSASAQVLQSAKLEKPTGAMNVLKRVAGSIGSMFFGRKK